MKKDLLFEIHLTKLKKQTSSSVNMFNTIKKHKKQEENFKKTKKTKGNSFNLNNNHMITSMKGMSNVNKLVHNRISNERLDDRLCFSQSRSSSKSETRTEIQSNSQNNSKISTKTIEKKVKNRYFKEKLIEVDYAKNLKNQYFHEIFNEIMKRKKEKDEKVQKDEKINLVKLNLNKQKSSKGINPSKSKKNLIKSEIKNINNINKYIKEHNDSTSSMITKKESLIENEKNKNFSNISLQTVNSSRGEYDYNKTSSSNKIINSLNMIIKNKVYNAYNAYTSDKSLYKQTSLINKINSNLNKSSNVYIKTCFFEEAGFFKEKNSEFNTKMEDCLICDCNDEKRVKSKIRLSPLLEMNNQKSHRESDPQPQSESESLSNSHNDSPALFAILDGHGGSTISIKSKELLYKKFKSYIKHSTPTNELPFQIERIFKEIDEELLSTTDCNSTGTTCSIAFIIFDSLRRNRLLYIAHIGDSHICIVSSKESKIYTNPHKCSNPIEVKRVKSSKGVVFNERLYGSLALSRAFGDKSLKPYGLISVPEILSVQIKERRINDTAHISFEYEFDLFVVLASDGLWDYVSMKEVYDVCLLFYRQEEGRNVQDLCRELCEKAKMNGSVDNISVVVIRL